MLATTPSSRHTRGITETPDAPLSAIPAANVGGVPNRSPLRYPGGKNWLIPHIRHWLDRIPSRPRILVEPFAGGASVSLTAVQENLVDSAILVEVDPMVAAFWKVAISQGEYLVTRLLRYTPTRSGVKELAESMPDNALEQAWRTLVLNRTLHNGILARGSALSRRGENDTGMLHRWYPETIIRRLRLIAEHSSRLTFCEADGFEVLEEVLRQHDPSEIVVFADPPYATAHYREAGRLYNWSLIDHQRLFRLLAGGNADFVATYNLDSDVIGLVENHQMHAVAVSMKTGHHLAKYELVITGRPVFPTWGTVSEQRKIPASKKSWVDAPLPISMDADSASP